MNEFTGFMTNDDNLFSSCQFTDELQNFHLPNLQNLNGVPNSNQMTNMFYHNDNNNAANISYCNEESSIVPASTTSNNIPFVRIHAFESSNNNAKISVASNLNRHQNDIKAEPIKAELNDAQCQSATTQSTQTPPASGTTTPAFATEITNALTTISSPVEGEMPAIQPALNSGGKPNSLPVLIKCEKCSFICISQTNLDIHVNSLHDENASTHHTEATINCPGCNNVFVSKHSLKIHLEYDHRMLSDDLEKVLETFLNEVPQCDVGKKKSRIYLKNVECLREKPQAKPVEERCVLPSIEGAFNKTTITNTKTRLRDEYDFIDLINDDNQTPPITDTLFSDAPINNPAPKQKITIKSVATLREPNYENNYFTGHDSQSNQAFNIQNSAVYYNMDAGFSSATTTQSNEMNPNNDFLLHNHFDNYHQNSSIGVQEKPKRAPKIYIKNVDIINEPIYLPSSTHMSNILNVNETLPFNNIFTPPAASNVSVVHQRLPITPISLQSHISSSANCSLTSIAGTNQLPPLFSTPSSFSHCNQDISIGKNTQPKNKIYIRNTDVLKQPQFQDNTGKKLTNFIHLRTVDELNLLDKTELNIMNNLSQNTSDKQQPVSVQNPSSDNSKNSDLDNSSNTYDVVTSNCNENLENNFPGSSNLQTSTVPTASNWENQDYNNGGFDSLDNFIDTGSNTNGTIERRTFQTQQYYDLNTPQRCDLSFDDVEVPNEDADQLEDDNDNDLFICSDELMPYRESSNSPFNAEQISIDLDSNLMVDVEIDEMNDNESRKEKDQIVLASSKNLFSSKTMETRNDDNQNSLEFVERVIEKTSTHTEHPKPNEKGRIYVSENLMEDRNKILTNDISDDFDSIPKRHKGRPFGAKTQKRKKGTDLNENAGAEHKCNHPECGFKFKDAKTLDYHKLCHSNETNQSMICPECKSTDFTSWNTLHTHLWRSHSIDMDLYSCDQCNFKTPILSRLLNTHSKIHSNERNFKCEVCDKAFKNSRQLKNHRRIHRKYPSNETIDLVKCDECDAVFSNKKSLKQHICPNNKQNVEEAQCSVCGKICSSKSYLKIHVAIHDEVPKYVCDCGEFSTNNPSSFRKHKARHTNDISKCYQCQYCDYQSIQASLYKKHLSDKHPEYASNVVHQCSHCKFSTIRKLQYYVHMAKNHNIDVSNLEKESENKSPTEMNAENDNVQDGNTQAEEQNENAVIDTTCDQKIDVKTDQFLLQSEANNDIT